MDAAGAEKWMKTLVNMGGYETYLLRHGPHAWDVYDGDGKFVGKSKNVVGRHVEECLHVVDVDREHLIQEAKSALYNDDVTLIACAESHAGASAADHSNFVLISRRMIIEAKPADMQHMFLVESRRYPCRVVGIYADVARLSEEMQDTFLDRWKWLQNSWPLVNQHHRDMLADRIAKSRSDFMAQLLADCGHAAGFSGDTVLGAQSRWTMSPPGAKYRFAQHVVSALAEGLIVQPGKAETFNHETIEKNAKKVMESYRTILR